MRNAKVVLLLKCGQKVGDVHFLDLLVPGAALVSPLQLVFVLR